MKKLFKGLLLFKIKYCDLTFSKTTGFPCSLEKMIPFESVKIVFEQMDNA